MIYNKSWPPSIVPNAILQKSLTVFHGMIKTEQEENLYVKAAKHYQPKAIANITKPKADLK
jgi:hypothetical protein